MILNSYVRVCADLMFREDFVFSFKRNDDEFYGCCRRFRDLRDVPDRRVDSTADLSIVCLCIITRKYVAFFALFCAQSLLFCHVHMICGTCSRWFRLFSELLQLFQWLYLTQPSSLSAVAQHLVTNLQEAILAGRRTGKPLASLNALWEGLQSVAVPRIPPFLCFSKERMLLLSTDDNLGFEQVSLLPLLSRLDHHSVITLFSAMLCERHIAFVSRHLPTLSSCLQAAVSLLYPFKWQVRRLFH
jgi:hypothetical protein